ncbi:hypothetical protein [Nocardia sp. NPDC055049]
MMITPDEKDCVARAFGFSGGWAALEKACREGDQRRKLRKQYPTADPALVATAAAEADAEERAMALTIEQQHAAKAKRDADRKEIQRAAGLKGVKTRRANAAARESAGVDA